MTQAESAAQSLATIKIPERTAADPDGIDLSYTFDPDDYDAEATHGFYMHSARKDHLGLTWLEYINSQPMRFPDAVKEAIIESVGEHVSASGGEMDEAAVREIVERVKDDLSADVREAAYTGAREAIQDMR